jgi:hypothetical protein
MADEVEPIAPVEAISPIPDNVPIHATALASTNDSVHLSTVAQVLLLKREGQSIEEIGQELGISVLEVESDLGIVEAIPSGPDDGQATS